MTSMMFEFKPNMSDSDSDCDIPVPDIARKSEQRYVDTAEVEHLIQSSVDEPSAVSSPPLAVDTSRNKSKMLLQNDPRRFSTRPLGAIEFQQLQVGELSAALLCSPALHPASMTSSSASTAGQASSGTGTGSTQASSQNQFETVKIKASGRTFRTNGSQMRDLMKRKAITLPQTVRYDDKGDQFFVDCSAEVFEEVFDFFRTGDLHLPKKVCIEKSLREMRRLNVFPNMLAPCCFARYDRFRAQKEAMKIWYEQLVKDPAEETNSAAAYANSSKKLPLRVRLWNFLENPFSSKFATTYSWITIIMVALSISGFIVETLPQIDVLLNNYKFQRQFGDLIRLCDQLANPSSIKSFNGTATNGTNSTLENATPEPPDIILFTPPSEQTSAPCPLTYDLKHDRFVATTRGPYNGEPTPTVSDCYIATTLWFIDYFAAAFFTLDLLVRLFVSPNKFEFFKSRLNLVDALALVPFYVELVFSILARMAYNQMWEVLEVFRSLRLLRIFRLAKWNYGLNVLYYTARAIVGPMSTLLTICIIGILFFGTIMYYVDARDRFTSIPISIYWAAITMTTVGYGDITPKSGQGCFIAALCASCGILVIGFVLPIVTSKFMFYYQHIKMGRYYKKMVRRSVAGDSNSSVSSTEGTPKLQQPTLREPQPKQLEVPLLQTALPQQLSVGENILMTAKDSHADPALQPIPEQPSTIPTQLSVDIDDSKLPKTFAERGPFIPSVDDAAETDYRMWNGKIDSVH